MAEIVGVGDTTTIGKAKACDKLDVVDKELTQGVLKWLNAAKVHFGELRDTAADRICLKRWLGEKMKAADMRDKDALGLIPVVVELMFVPTIDDALAAQVKRSRVAATMKACCPRPAA